MADWLTDWLRRKIDSRSIRPTTAVAYRGHVENYLIPHLGHLPLAALRPQDVTQMLIAVRDEHDRRRADAITANAADACKVVGQMTPARKGGGPPIRSPRRCVAVPRPFGPATAQRVRATLRSALSAAYRAGLAPRNVAALADVAQARRPKVAVWQPHELGRFLDAIVNEPLYALFHLAAFAGLRRGELCGLRWRDVDLRAQLIEVAAQRTTAAHTVVAAVPKTDNVDSRVDIDARTAAVLHRHRRTQIAQRLVTGPGWRESGLVFTAADGRGLHPDYVSKYFQTLIARHGLPKITLHGLRHVAASLQIAAGIDIAVVSKRLRHSSIKITSDTYVHLIGTIGRQAAEAAAALVPLQRSLPVIPGRDIPVDGVG
ncbi:tyrosine-type recombinase/integrase [Virgisporangium ochraceum]|uniref:tyrosine-type recombinase/integrase n=1 Tax=Virgisporangium ochraceum TaxID=65505 RepID=UPI0019415539|nr:site-specific integrase [Virgisporangium ochraceum]